MTNQTIIKYFFIALFIQIFSNYSNAAQIYVNSTSGAPERVGFCTLRSAINSANLDQQIGTCNAGNGEDTIILPPNSLITLYEPDNYNVGRNALPIVNSKIIIEGNNAIITQSDSSLEMRFFYISANLQDSIIGDLTLRDLALTNAHHDSNGGAINNVSQLLLERVRFTNNSGGFGGAISCSGSVSNCFIKDSLFNRNSASYGGAIYSSLVSNVEVINSYINDNSATGSGGAIYVSEGWVSIINSTIDENNAEYSGGIYMKSFNSNVSKISIIDSSTIAFNEGHGLTSDYNTEKLISVSNSIISNNGSNNCGNYDTIQSNGYNLISDSSCRFYELTDDIDVDVMLEPKKAYSSLGHYTYPLSPYSPAIDSGKPNCLSEDQRGMLRPIDGNYDGISVCDRGAHEQENYLIFNNGFE